MLEKSEREESDDTRKQVVVELRTNVVHLVDDVALPRDVDEYVETKHTGMKLLVHVAHTRVPTGDVHPVAIDGVLDDVTVLPDLSGSPPFHDVESCFGLNFHALSIDQSHDSHLSGV